MKTKLLILILFICGSARANLIELTPGGFNVDNAPPAFYRFLHQWSQHQFDFFDEATPDGWVSLYGILDGGTYFNTDLIGHPGQSATVNWDFTALPGYGMSRLLIQGRASDGSAWANIYAVPYNLRDLDTFETVIGGEDVNILSIDFFGRWPGSPVPDTGGTAALFGIAIAAVLFGFRSATSCDEHHSSLSR